MATKFKLVLPAVITMAVVYYADYLIFAPPIVAMTAWLGPWQAFAILVPIYFVIDYFLGTFTLSLVKKDDNEHREKKSFLRPVYKLIRKWFQVYAEILPSIEKRLSPRLGLLLRAIGFVFASYWGTAFLTMPAMYILGQRRYLRTLTAASAAIYAVTFVGQTAGLTFLGLKLINLAVEYF